MKKFFCILLCSFYFLNMFVLPAFCSNTEKQDSLLAKYDLTESQKKFIKNITNSDQNLDTAEFLIENNLTEDCRNSLKNVFGSSFYASKLYVIAKAANPKHLSKKELKKIDKDFGNDYFVQIDNNFYNGVSKIDFEKVSPNSNVKVYDQYFYKDIKTLKKYLAIQEKYALSDRMMHYVMKDTNKLSLNMDTLNEALEDGLYEKYASYCHGKSSDVSASGFRSRYTAVKKIETSEYLNEKQKEEAYLYRYSITKANGNYYENLYKIEDFSKIETLEYYSKNKFPYVEKLKEYNAFQKEFNLDNTTMNNVWEDSKKLTKDTQLIKSALRDGTYQEYIKLKSNKYSRNKPSMFFYGETDTKFKENYIAYLYMKEHTNFEQKQMQKIIMKDGEPDVAINPYYWGNKEKKIKKTMKKKKLSDEEKYKQVIDRLYYRRPTAKEWADDTATKALIAGLFLSGIGIIGGIMALAGYSDANGHFIKIVW